MAKLPMASQWPRGSPMTHGRADSRMAHAMISARLERAPSRADVQRTAVVAGSGPPVYPALQRSGAPHQTGPRDRTGIMRRPALLTP